MNFQFQSFPLSATLPTMSLGRSYECTKLERLEIVLKGMQFAPTEHSIKAEAAGLETLDEAI